MFGPIMAIIMCLKVRFCKGNFVLVITIVDINLLSPYRSFSVGVYLFLC
jgi:hypothetical protein